MAGCTLVKLEAYRERGSHMRCVATATKGRVRGIMGWRGCRSSTANVVCHGIFFFAPLKDTVVYAGSTLGFFVIDNSTKRM